jgi:hypothetical protein
MTEDEYKTLRVPAPKVEPTISIDDLTDKKPRTLLWGYTTDRWSHHVYIENEKIHVFSYAGREIITNSLYRDGVLVAKSVVPNKRLYPEACDIEFCLILKNMGIYLPFTNWDDMREEKQYHGRRYSEANQQLCDEGKVHNESMCSQYH